MPKNPRVYELARELGLSNKETLDLCDALGIGVKSHSSSVQEAQADRVRRKADREGLIRAQQPQEEVEQPKPAKKRAPVKKAVVKKAPAKKAAPPKNSEVLENSAITDSDESPKSDVKLAPASTISPSSSKDDEPANDDLKENFAAKKAAPSRPLPPPPLNMPPPRPLVTSSGQESVKPRPPEDVPVPAVVAVIPNATEVVASPPEEEAAAKASPAEASPEIGTQPVSPPRMPAPPKSVNGKPIPPPPTKPRSVTGKAIPPPPGPPRSRTASKPAGSPAGRGTGAPRGGPARPGSSPSSPARPGAAPGGPGGRPDDRGGPGGRPGGGRGGPQQRRGRKQKRRRRQVEELQPQQAAAYTPVDAPVPEGEVRIERGSTAQEVASRLNRSAADIVKFLLQQGEMVTATQSLTDDNIELFATDLGAEVRLIDPGAEQEQEILRTLDLAFDQDSEEVRPPVITVMGHVDHGKTLLLDRIRSANVIAGEAGGITQHIGAYQVTRNGQSLTFIDTPGHEAFTSMRARGAKATDIVILVVAADDGVMPQTLEAIDHARAAEVPIIVAINKMDREGADQNRVLAQLAERNLIPESYGGDVITVPLSAMTEEGIDDLLDQVVLVAELEELTAGSQGRALGTVLESNLDKGRGPVATVLVQQGTLSVGDPVVAGAAWGRVRAMTDALGNQLKQAGPSTPVEVLGLSEVPRAGDMFTVAPDEKTASKVADTREHWQRQASMAGVSAAGGGAKLEDIFKQIQAGEAATLNLVLKADVHGSLEAVTESLRKLERPEVKLAFVSRGVGGVNENDIQLAMASNATILGFNVRPDRKARQLAEFEGVEIRLYEIIYKLLEDIENAMLGMLTPEFEEIVTGEAHVRQVFRISGVGPIAGCVVESGTIADKAKVRFLRQGTIIWKGQVKSLRHFQDQVASVTSGMECGIGLSDFTDLKEGDVIETYDEKEIPRT